MPTIASTIRAPTGGCRTELDGHGASIPSGMAVRRLLPIEVERLFGFCDNYTLIPYRGKSAKDGPRYRALGNSFAVPVVRWIGKHIQLVEDLK